MSHLPVSFMHTFKQTLFSFQTLDTVFQKDPFSDALGITTAIGGPKNLPLYRFSAVLYIFWSHGTVGVTLSFGTESCQTRGYDVASVIISDEQNQ